jgi:hypothetical protein
MWFMNEQLTNRVVQRFVRDRRFVTDVTSVCDLVSLKICYSPTRRARRMTVGCAVLCSQGLSVLEIYTLSVGFQNVSQ